MLLHCNEKKSRVAQSRSGDATIGRGTFSLTEPFPLPSSTKAQKGGNGETLPIKKNTGTSTCWLQGRAQGQKPAPNKSLGGFPCSGRDDKVQNPTSLPSSLRKRKERKSYFRDFDGAGGKDPFIKHFLLREKRLD